MKSKKIIYESPKKQYHNTEVEYLKENEKVNFKL